MEDNYRKSFSKSSERTANPDDLDPLCLFVRQIPSDMSQDEFASFISCEGRIVPHHVNVIKKPNVKYSFGFVRFATHEEALNALNDLNGTPPYYFSVIFANNKNKKNENENKGHSNSENMLSFKGRGRGQRISLDSPISRIKIVAGDDGRKVTVDSFPEKSASECTDLDSLSKVPNPFYFCFVCGQEGIYSCKHCRKPYCSKNCQVLDFSNHKELCKRGKELVETLLCIYKNFPVQSCDSGMSESSNSEPEKLDSVVEIKPEVIHKSPQVLKAVENLVLSPGEVEIVNVLKIESPSKFSVRLKKYFQEFSTMEDQLTSQKKNLKQFPNQIRVSPELNCCTLYNEKICRTKVLKVKSLNEILVDLLDYGKIVTVQKCALLDLPSEFRNLPAQAIPCRLVSDENEIIQWNEGDTLSFELHTSNKPYKAHVFSCSNGVYDVALINDDGIPLHSILIEEKKAVCDGPTLSQTDGKPPTIWTKLKLNAKMLLIHNITSDDFIWCYLTFGESDLKEIMEIEKLLQNYSGQDISQTADKDDFAAGFSNEYNQYYRCRILKRKDNSFLVHYIDYGNEEEITRLSSLSEELLQRCCYLVRCEKPSNLSATEFHKCLGESGVDVSVLKFDEKKAVLSVHHKQQCSITCYPCYSNFMPENEARDKKSPPVISKVRLPSKTGDIRHNVNGHNSVSEKNVLSNCKPKTKIQNVNDYKIVAEKITVPKVLSPSTNFNVKIVFIKTASELYVQLKEDEIKMKAMMNTLNGFCNSKNGAYVPNIGEIVSCKFNDGVWYRGQVLEKLNNNYRVFFVDYGNEDIVSQNDIQILSDRFISPQFSICISLSGMKNEDISKSLLSKLLKDDWDMRVMDPEKKPVEVMLYQKDIPIIKMIESKTNKIKSSLKFQNLSSKSTVKICFEDDKYLYVNLVKDIKPLEEMSKKLNNSSNLPTPKNPKINNIYAGLFSDGLFYRVSIEETLSSDSFNVYFLDYGNYATVSATNLRELPDDIFALPVYCIPLHVQDRNKLTLTMDDEYTVEVIGMKDNVQIVKFLDLEKSSDVTVENAVKLNENKNDANDKGCLIYKKLPEVGVVDVKVCYVDQKLVYVHQISDLQIVEDVLVKMNSSSKLLPVVQPVVNKVYCGLFSDGCWYRVSVEEITSNNSYKVYFLDFGNYETLPVDNLKELPSDLFSIPVCCIPVVMDESEKLTFNLEEQYKVQVIGKQNNLQVIKLADDHKNKSVNVVDVDKKHLESSKSDVNIKEIENLPNISSFKKQKLQDGLNEVIFCHLEGNIVYCQLSSDDDHVLSMFKILQKCGREGKAPVSSLSVGDVVCAQSSDALWYRACIIGSKKAPSYKVLFFDYGNTESVTEDCIKILPNELLNVPIFAIPMQIQNADNIKDTTVYTKPMLVKKIKEINGDTYVVELQLENVGCPKISTLKKLTLPDNAVSNVTICHVDDSLYYIQPTSNMDNLEKLNNKLSEADTFSNVPNTPEEGDIICAKFIDGLWYRCAIKKVSNKIEVCFIDYGNSDSVSITSIKMMPLELSSYAVASIAVKFKDEDAVRKKILENITTINVKVCDKIDNIQVVDIVSHMDSNDKPKTEHVSQVSYTPTFLSSFTKSFLSLKESCKVQLKINVDDLYVAIKQDDGAEIEKLNLILRDCKTDIISHLPSVNEVLLAEKDNVLHRCAVLNFFAEKNVYEMYFVDLGITENLPKGALRTLPDVCKTFPLFAIKVAIESDQSVSLDKFYNIHALNQNPDGTYHIKVYHQYNYSLISRKELAPMKISDVIFCHKEGEKLFLQEIADADVLNEVQKGLGCLSGSDMPYKPNVGELVCAMSQLDNSWYRGCIEEVISNSEFKIFFIDYGNYENIPIKYLQPMPFSLTKFPMISIPVKFENTKLTERIELLNIYQVQADTKASNNVQIIRLVEKKEGVAATELKSVSENLKKNDTKKFLFDSCKYVPFKSGQQEIVIYSVDEEGCIYCAPYNIENIQANLSLPGLITEHCVTNGISYDDREPEVSEMVLALYPADNNWYRAVVIQKSHPEYDVSFVDYGNIESINIASLRKMEEKFMELDIQAHMCSLSGFTYLPENLDKVCSVLKKFEVLSYQEPLTANVKIIDGEISVNIPIITSQLLQEKLVTVVDEK